MSNADDLRRASPWSPVTSPLSLAHLGKLAEELGEACAAVSRCIIQGVNECEPVTGKPNKVWLEDELADVHAGIILGIERFDLDRERMAYRRIKKIEYLRGWHEQLIDTHRPEGEL